MTKASSYNTVLRYVNPNLFPLVGTVSIYPIGQPDSPEAIVHKVKTSQGWPQRLARPGRAGIFIPCFRWRWSLPWVETLLL